MSTGFGPLLASLPPPSPLLLFRCRRFFMLTTAAGHPTMKWLYQPFSCGRLRVKTCLAVRVPQSGVFAAGADAAAAGAAGAFDVDADDSAAATAGRCLFCFFPHPH